MLTEKQTAFLKTWLDHQTWPVEDEAGNLLDPPEEVVCEVVNGYDVRFQAPLDSDGEPLISGQMYRNGDEIRRCELNHHTATVSFYEGDWSFFDCPTLRKRRPELVIKNADLPDPLWVEKPEKWKPKYAEEYWYWSFRHDVPRYDFCQDTEVDLERQFYGNCHKSKEECVEWAKKKELGL